MTPGVYLIICVPLQKFYVGQTNCTYKRWGFHKFQLRQGSHDTKALQKDWDEHGESEFKFVLVRKIESKSDRLKLESLIIQRLNSTNPNLGYNKAEFGNRCPHSVTTREKMSKIARERNKRPEYKKMLIERANSQHAAGTLHNTPEGLKKTGAKLKGKKLSAEHVKKIVHSCKDRNEQLKAAARKSVLARGMQLKSKVGSEDFLRLKG